MAYVLNADLTDAYIQSLVARNGYTDVSNIYDWGSMYVFQDLNGALQSFGDMTSARDWLVAQYCIIQNS